MASKYSQEIVKIPTKGIVLEDNVWEFGKPKKKAKINIPALLPLQEPSEIVKKSVRKTNAGIVEKVVERTLNYIEIYLPDSLYTYPTDYEVENEEPEIRGASKENPKRTEKNGETKPGLVRLVKKNTQLMLIIMDAVAIEDNIRIIGKYDDFDPEKEEAEESKLAGYVSTSTRKSAKRSGSSSNPAGNTGSKIRSVGSTAYDSISAKNSSSQLSKMTKISALRT